MADTNVKPTTGSGVAGMPHESQCARSSMVMRRRHGITTSSPPPRELGAGARIGRNWPWTAGHGQTVPDTTEAAPQPCSRWPETVLAAWQVKDSNLRRHQPTDLQSAAIRISAAHCMVMKDPRFSRGRPTRARAVAIGVTSRSHGGLVQVTRTDLTGQLHAIVPAECSTPRCRLS
jgi:hypothetical protein